MAIRAPRCNGHDAARRPAQLAFDHPVVIHGRRVAAGKPTRPNVTRSVAVM